MDPNEALTRLRNALTATRDALNDDAPDEVEALVTGDPLVSAATELADAVQAMDEWMSDGGRLPLDWVAGIRAN